MSVSKPKDELIDAYQALAWAGHADFIWGHASSRDPDGRGLWMKAAGYAFEEINLSRLLLVGWDGEVLEGDGERHIEWVIHSQVMAARPDVQSVVHTHAPQAAIFASLDVPLRALSHDGTPFACPDIPRFTVTSDVLRDTTMGDRLAQTLGEQPGVLLPGHGLVTAGTTIAAASMYAVLLNRACEQQIAAISGGGPRIWTNDDEVRVKQGNWNMKNLQAGFDYMVRSARSGGHAARL